MNKCINNSPLPAPATLPIAEPVTGWFYWFWIELGTNEDLDYMWEWPNCWLGKAGNA